MIVLTNSIIFRYVPKFETERIEECKAEEHRKCKLYPLFETNIQ